MAEKFKFYVQMDGRIFGPYSARDIIDLRLLDDILVTEESMNGEWLPASEFDFIDMARKEAAYGYTAPSPVPPFPESGLTGYGPGFPYPYSGEPNLKKWNWGAFFFNWLWGVFNGVYWPLVLIIINFIPYVGGVIYLGACIVLGIKGSEWAWKGKRWNSVTHFEKVQHNWAMACVWVLLGIIALSLLIVIAIFAAAS